MSALWRSYMLMDAEAHEKCAPVRIERGVEAETIVIKRGKMEPIIVSCEDAKLLVSALNDLIFDIGEDSGRHD